MIHLAIANNIYIVSVVWLVSFKYGFFPRLISWLHFSPCVLIPIRGFQFCWNFYIYIIETHKPMSSECKRESMKN